MFEQGTFFIGCNYWASHAGTHMWTDWRTDAVEFDFKRLSTHGVTTLRVFPLWPVFQPISRLYGNRGTFREYRFGESPLPDTDAGRAGMSEEALGRFAEFCDLAGQYGMRLVVGLITGWMSGRLFVPPALEGRNVLTDPTAIMWQARFIRYFVKRFRDRPCIVAWDLGNECNEMGQVANADEAYAWTSNIVGAIRSTDASRPVVSGMHSLLPDNNWPMQVQGELTDVLTTHPYPYFTPHCDMDPIHTIRTELHAVAETLFYRGIGGKPCFAEECGTLGPMFADEARAADFIRTNLFTLWAHDCRGFMWWCANEQSHLTHAPYDWNACERELGLFRADHSPKPVIRVMKEFVDFLGGNRLSALPGRMTDGVCVLTREQDTWGAAYMSFILAKQAGLEIEFAYADQPLPDAPLYLMPSVSGDTFMPLRRYQDLLRRVENGAVLYISMDTALLSPFREFSGVTVLTRERAGYVEDVIFRQSRIPIRLNFKLRLEATGATVLACDGAGNPMFTVNEYGKGRVFFLAAPLETYLTEVNDAFGQDSPYAAVYDVLKGAVGSRKVATVNKRNVGMTEHAVNSERRILVLINYDPEPADVTVSLANGWQSGAFLRGSLSIPANDAAVLEIVRR